MKEPGHRPPAPAEGDINLSASRAAWQAEHLGAESRELLARDERVFIRQSLSTPCLNALTESRGASLIDPEGREYLDFHGNSVHQVGYGHPRVVAAVTEALARLPFCPRRYTNEDAVRLAEELTGLWPWGPAKLLFAPGGAEAVGLALKLARIATGRHKTVSFWDSFHGATLETIGVGGEALFRSGIGPLLPGAAHVPPPEPFRCRLNPSGDCPRCGLRCVAHIDYVMAHEGDVGALIAEPIRCTAVHLPPDGFWPAVREVCDKHRALLILDETAVCLGRAGTMLASEAVAAEPDILTLGKGLGGGVMPLAACLARAELDLAPDLALGHYTHEKSSLGCAAGLAALGVIRDEGLLQRSRDIGLIMATGLGDMEAQNNLIGDIRVLGGMAAVELVRDRKTKEPAVEEADRVLYGCLARGLSFKTSHGNILTLTPPLTITDRELERALEIIDETLWEL